MQGGHNRELPLLLACKTKLTKTWSFPAESLYHRPLVSLLTVTKTNPTTVDPRCSPLKLTARKFSQARLVTQSGVELGCCARSRLDATGVPKLILVPVFCC